VASPPSTGVLPNVDSRRVPSRPTVVQVGRPPPEAKVPRPETGPRSPQKRAADRPNSDHRCLPIPIFVRGASRQAQVAQGGPAAEASAGARAEARAEAREGAWDPGEAEVDLEGRAASVGSEAALWDRPRTRTGPRDGLPSPVLPGSGGWGSLSSLSLSALRLPLSSRRPRTIQRRRAPVK